MTDLYLIAQMDNSGRQTIYGPFADEDSTWDFADREGVDVEDILPLIPERHRDTPVVTP